MGHFFNEVDKKTKSMIIIAFCLKKAYSLYMRQMLIPVAETHRKFEPMLAGKGSSGSDRLDVLSEYGTCPYLLNNVFIWCECQKCFCHSLIYELLRCSATPAILHTFAIRWFSWENHRVINQRLMTVLMCARVNKSELFSCKQERFLTFDPYIIQLSY